MLIRVLSMKTAAFLLSTSVMGVMGSNAVFAAEVNLKNDDSTHLTVEMADMQRAIEAFGVSTAQAESAASHAISMIEHPESAPQDDWQKYANIPEDFLDMSPY